jgi:hypothetical protein
MELAFPGHPSALTAHPPTPRIRLLQALFALILTPTRRQEIQVTQETLEVVDLEIMDSEVISP